MDVRITAGALFIFAKSDNELYSGFAYPYQDLSWIAALFMHVRWIQCETYLSDAKPCLTKIGALF